MRWRQYECWTVVEAPWENWKEVMFGWVVFSLPRTPTSHSCLSPPLALFSSSFLSFCSTAVFWPWLSWRCSELLPLLRLKAASDHTSCCIFICQVVKRRTIMDTPLARNDEWAGPPLLFCLALICVTRAEGSPQFHLPASRESLFTSWRPWLVLCFWFRSVGNERE